MIKNIKKFIKINAIIFRNAYIRDSKVPGFVFIGVISQLFDVLVSIIFFDVIFANSNTLVGWNFYQVLFLFAYIKFIAAIHQAWTKKGINSVTNELIRLGDYDFYLTKPYNSMLLVSISKPRLYSFITAGFDLGLMIYAAAHAGIHLAAINMFWFVFLTIFSVILFYFLSIICVVPTFWATRLSALTVFMNRLITFARYPSPIFSPVSRMILSTIIPILVVSYFPVTTLFYPPKISYIIYMIFITVAFGFITQKLWQFGERNYGSASS